MNVCCAAMNKNHVPSLGRSLQGFRSNKESTKNSDYKTELDITHTQLLDKIVVI